MANVWTIVAILVVWIIIGTVIAARCDDFVTGPFPNVIIDALWSALKAPVETVQALSTGQGFCM